MLFNSYIFILIFLPITLMGYYFFSMRSNPRIAIFLLVIASLFFYGWWNPSYLGLILTSILFNYWNSRFISRSTGASRKYFSIFGIAANLALLGYFKYANFFLENLNVLFFDSVFHLSNIVLPLAISFFTFQQIAFIVDTYKGEVDEHSFLDYCLFVTFFPQLIAGPIVHHKEMLPQFKVAKTLRENQQLISMGLTIFIIGLFKKVVIADTLANFATPVFAFAELNYTMSFAEAWTGAIAYTLQLYFDFSGYSDMAIGIAFMFGIRLPENFNSPYKATNIIEFWRRWHMTLSRFLRDYLYIPLGGNRMGNIRRLLNLMLTMILGGLWHGAGWTFVFWGTLHGFYLVVNHGWKILVKRMNLAKKEPTFIGKNVAWLITFVAIIISWVFFRAESFQGALNILSAMSMSSANESIVADMAILAFPNELISDQLEVWVLFAALMIIVRYAPTTVKWVTSDEPNRFFWAGRTVDAVTVALLFAISIFHIQSYSEFLYFQF